MTPDTILDKALQRTSAPDYPHLLEVLTEWMRSQNETNDAAQKALARIETSIEQLENRITRIEDANKRWIDLSPGNSLTY